MGVSREELKEYFNQRCLKKEITLSDIPDIDLYIDQITTLFENKLGDSKRNEEEKILTKTMVNNYSKEGILRPVKGKKYDREHILQMSMICLMKQTLSLLDIKKILTADTYNKKDSLLNAYEGFLSIKEDQHKKILSSLDEFIDCFDTKDDEQFLALILYLCNYSTIIKNTVETLVDKCFKDPKPAKEEKSKKEVKPKKEKSKKSEDK